MAVITIKVDEALKDRSAAVLEELGLDLPTAIRMYLKSVVRENGLPISTKLPSPVCVCAEAPAAEETPAEEAPAEEAPAEEAPAVLLDEEAEQALEEDDLIDDVAAEEKAPAKEPAVVIDYETRAGRKAVAALFMDTILSVPAGQLTRSSCRRARSQNFFQSSPAGRSGSTLAWSCETVRLP